MIPPIRASEDGLDPQEVSPEEAQQSVSQGESSDTAVLLPRYHARVTCSTGVGQCKHPSAPASFSFFYWYVASSRGRLRLILLRLTPRQAQLSLVFMVLIRRTALVCLGMRLWAAASLVRVRAVSASKAMPGRVAASLGSATSRLGSKGRARAMLGCGERPGRRLGQEENFITSAAGT
jgi:hypothetical protein